MIDLRDLPCSKAGDYNVYFHNVFGSCSMVTIMRHDGQDIELLGEHKPPCLMVGIVVSVTDAPRFEWHENVHQLKELPFNEEWVIVEWKKHRKN